MTIAAKGAKRTVFVPCRMTPAEAEALQKLADDRSCSVAAVLRWAVRTAVMNTQEDDKEIEQA